MQQLGRCMALWHNGKVAEYSDDHVYLSDCQSVCFCLFVCLSVRQRIYSQEPHIKIYQIFHCTLSVDMAWSSSGGVVAKRYVLPVL